MKLILASASPRRKQLLSLLNIPFEIVVADIDENIDNKKDLTEEIKRLSFLKAQKVYENHQDATIIGADTIVTINNEVLGKPKDLKDAERMIELLQGNKHQVITGVTIMNKDQTISFASSSDVYFNQMTKQEIQDYLSLNESMDKAGAYAIQGYGAKYIKKIDGDYYSIMGLPVCDIYNILKNFD